MPLTRSSKVASSPSAHVCERMAYSGTLLPVLIRLGSSIVKFQKAHCYGNQAGVMDSLSRAVKLEEF